MRLLCSLLGLTGLCFACDHAPAAAVPAAATPGAPADSAPVAAVAPGPTASATATTIHMPAPASTCAKGWIDGCGSCYPPCETDADCKVKGQTCQPIVCTHTLYGNGCLAPESSSTASGGADAGAPVAAARARACRSATTSSRGCPASRRRVGGVWPSSSCACCAVLPHARPQRAEGRCRI